MKFSLFHLFIFLLIPLSLFAEPTSVSTTNNLKLSDSEKAWLQTHRTIHVGMDSEYAPYEWVNQNGNYVGMAVDYLHLLEQKLGIHFEIVKGKSWSEVVELAKKGEIDVLTSIVQTPERLKYFIFSEPYRDTQSMIVDNGEGEFIGSLAHLARKRVAVEKGYFTQELIETKYPKIQLVLANNILDALNLVIDGKADAYVGDMSAINYVIKNNGLTKLRISGQTEFLSQHRFAFSKSHPELASIMTKAMASISAEESDIIFNRWIGMRIEQGIRAETIFKYSVGLIGLFMLFGYWYYRLRCEIKNRKAAEMREHYQNNILEMIAKMVPLSTVLGTIVKEVEEQNPSMFCSILLLDKEAQLFSQVIAPSLPDFYNEAIKGVQIGRGVGSCGTAAYLKERVVVEDIATHPYWKAYKEIALRAGLQSCWSEPILSSDGSVLGTFAIYHANPKSPTKVDIILIEQSANLASIAIEKSMVATKLRESEELYRRLTEEVTDVIWKTDRNLVITYISPADEKFRGYRADEVIGHHAFEMFSAEGVATISEKLKQRYEAEQKGIHTDFVTYEIQHQCKDGRLIWGEIISKPERNDKGEIIGFHGITREVTERKTMQEKVQQLAFYDPLTKLPNRLLLSERLNYTLAEIKRNHKYAALLFLDLDNFKSLNDTHGHSIGDLLLCQVADRLKLCVREIDTIARFGGDEFVVILNALHEEKNESVWQAQKVAEKIRQSLSALYMLNVSHNRNEEYFVEHSCTASIGVLVFNSEEGSLDDLLKQADAAMYKAKEAGKNVVSFCESKL
ncbi:diguanylate cyclase domain-containing protein [Sulfurospirillum oryzae]|uniref:diguanylate cyclase domain-containing protein n=1 Tax=Sulfurospirillum oryzae TaxID=2976535 RepID=UPI0021E8A931|nr:transporter substrate-binding domain-containing protein [Sulfurospirillum oryzae]